ncbi:MAG: M23 family metallopeptidase [Myxococcota bacterium]
MPCRSIIVLSTCGSLATACQGMPPPTARVPLVAPSPQVHPHPTTPSAARATEPPPAPAPPAVVTTVELDGAASSPCRALSSPHPRSGRLPSGLYNPMPSGILGGYEQDTGLDIAGFEMPVYALADATVVYAEAGHTRWPHGSPYTVLLELTEPLNHGDRTITHAWYAHLKELFVEKATDDDCLTVTGGTALGISGYANRSPHLHLGLLLDGDTEQSLGNFLLFDAVREVLGPFRHRQRLPAMPSHRAGLGYLP